MDLAAHGISCSLGTGWSGCIHKHTDGSSDVFAPCVHAGSCSMPATPQSTYGIGVVTAMTASQAFVCFAEQYPDDVVTPGKGSFAAGMPGPLTLSDFSADRVHAGDNPVSPTLVATQKFCTVNGRPFILYAALGQPTQALVNSVNSMLATVQVTPPNDAYRAAVLRGSGLVSYWRLGELSGTSAVDECGVNPGTYTGPKTQGSGALIQGSSNTSVLFPGVQGGGAISVPASPSLTMTSAFTHEFWFKPSSMSPIGNRHVLCHKIGAYFLAVTAAGEVELNLTYGSGAQVNIKSQPGIVAANQTYQIVAVLGGPAFGSYGVPCNLYVDGCNVAAGTVPVPIAAGGNLVLGGYLNNLVCFVKGTLDEITVSNVAVPIEDLHERFRLGAGRAPVLDQYSTVVRETPGLSGYWRMHEHSGSVCRDSVGTSHGVKNGAWVAASTLIGNSPDRALTLNTGTLTIDNAETQLPTPFSLETWIGPYEVSAGDACILTKPGSYLLRATSTNAVRFGIYAGALVPSVTSPAGSLPLNQIRHVVGTYDGTTLRLYINGTQVASAPYSGPRGLPATPLQFGDSTLRAAMDEVAIYKVALTADQIAEHYRIGAGGKLDVAPPPPPPPAPPPGPPDPGPDEPPYFVGTGIELSPEEA